MSVIGLSPVWPGNATATKCCDYTVARPIHMRLAVQQQQQKKMRAYSIAYKMIYVNILSRTHKISFIIRTSNQKASQRQRTCRACSVQWSRRRVDDTPKTNIDGVLTMQTSNHSGSQATMATWACQRQQEQRHLSTAIHINGQNVTQRKQHHIGVVFASSVMYRCLCCNARCYFVFFFWLLFFFVFSTLKSAFTSENQVNSATMNTNNECHMHTHTDTHSLSFPLSLPRTIHFYGIQSVETILAIKW